MKKKILVLIMAACSLMAMAAKQEVVVEFEDGTSKTLLMKDNFFVPLLNIPDRNLKFEDPVTGKKENYSTDSIKSVSFTSKGKDYKIVYSNVYDVKMGNPYKTSDKLSKRRYMLSEVYKGKNITVYAMEVVQAAGPGATVKYMYTYFQRKGEYPKYVASAPISGIIVGKINMQKFLLGYFTEEDFVKRIKAGEFDVKKTKDWSVEHMVEVAKAYDER